MAKNSGSTRNNTHRGTQAVTERGYSRRLERNILTRERDIRNNRDESLHFYDSSGDELVSYQGKGARVGNEAITSPLPSNAIITHNHPRAIGKQGIEAIGNSFSVEDLITAVRTNAQEIRAVTPTYTFSMKRPATGWGATVREVYYAYHRTEKFVRAKLEKYKDDVGTGIAARRARALHFHLINRQLAKEFGWIYSKKNS